MNIKFIFQSILMVVIIGFFNLNISPFGIAFGTTVLIPVSLLYLANYHNIGINTKIACILFYYLVARTIDWFYAPGRHDSEGVGVFYVLSILSSLVILFIFLKDNFKLSKQNLIIVPVICILPYLQTVILSVYFNNHLNTTRNNLLEYLLK